MIPTGRSPSWYLRSIVITDTKTHKEYPFICDKRLAVESEDGKIERLLSIAGEKDLKKFHLVFASTVSKGLLDGHIWFSIFLRPKQSSFTRVRRLSACLALIFLTMLTNAMFFGVGDAPGSRKIVWLGNFKINFTGIMIGIQSSIIVIPPSIIIIEIFRRLAPKKIKESSKVKATDESNDDTRSIKSDPYDVGSNDENPLTKDDDKHTKDKKKGPFLLPNPFKYIAYFFVIACTASSAVVCFFYSMMWGPRKSNEWLSSMFAGFFQSVLVIQPMKAVVVAILLAAIFRKPVKQESAEECAETPMVCFLVSYNFKSTIS